MGGGFFSGFTVLSVEEAWQIHGEGNGVSSLSEFTHRIAHYRKDQPNPRAMIGCVLLRDLFFTSSTTAIDAPSDFAKSIVRFKGYDLGTDSSLEATLRDLLDRSTLRIDMDIGEPLAVPGGTRGLPILTVPRVGQQAFKSLVLTSYHRRCAFTGSRIEPVLQAAHIRPVSDHGQHRVDNGLLLRSDLHTLFDRGYLGVDHKYRMHVSPRLNEDFGNGKDLYAKQSAVIDLPDRVVDRPNREMLEWHMDSRFLR